MSRPLILYHANCADGFCAAWVAHRKFGDDADYIPVQYGQEPPDVTGREVYILDFSYKRTVFLGMAHKAAKLLILDHHKTAREDFEGLVLGNHLTIANNVPGSPVLQFDMDRSGGRLAWDHFFPDEPAPWLVAYTEDRDLWRWQLPHSREVSAALASHPKDFASWDEWAGFGKITGLLTNGRALTTPPHTLIAEGGAILRYQAELVDSHCRNAVETEIDGHKVLAVNATCLFSEIAGKLAESRPFGAAYFIRQDGKKQWSLRSRDGGVDVSEVAKRHGGGGHRNAAGFEE